MIKCAHCYKEYDEAFGGNFCPKCESIVSDCTDIEDEIKNGEMDDD